VQAAKSIFALAFQTRQEVAWLPRATRVLPDQLSSIEIRVSSNRLTTLTDDLKAWRSYQFILLTSSPPWDLKEIFAKVCRDFEAELIECNGEDDHVHVLIVYPPKIALSKLVNSLKGVSSRLLREWRPEITGRYKDGVLWSPSYFVASCGGAPLTIIAEYVKSQREALQERSRLPPRPKVRGFSRGSR
jgi:putative transposase